MYQSQQLVLLAQSCLRTLLLEHQKGKGRGEKKEGRTHSGLSLMNPNLVNNLTSLPFSNSRINSASRVSSALLKGEFEKVRSAQLSSALLITPHESINNNDNNNNKTHTKLAFNSSKTLAPINAKTSSIVFLGPGLLKRYNTTFLRSGL